MKLWFKNKDGVTLFVEEQDDKTFEELGRCDGGKWYLDSASNYNTVLFVEDILRKFCKDKISIDFINVIVGELIDMYVDKLELEHKIDLLQEAIDEG